MCRYNIRVYLSWEYREIHGNRLALMPAGMERQLFIKGVIVCKWLYFPIAAISFATGLIIEEVTTRSLPVRLSGHLAFEIDNLDLFLREYRTVFTKVERYTLHGTQVAYAIGPNGEEVEWIEKMRLSNNEPH